MRTPLMNNSDTHWWTYTVPTAGSYSIRLGELPSAYRLAVYYPGGSTATSSSGTADRVRTLTLAAGTRIDIAVTVGQGTAVPDRAYALSVTPPTSAAGSSWFARLALAVSG